MEPSQGPHSNITPQLTSRDLSIDFIRVIAVFFVLVLHISEGVTNHWGNVPLFDWMSGNFYNSFSRFCVPVLFMASGFLLLGKEESLKVFYSKRMQKILIPLLAWSVIYLLLSQDYSKFTPFNAFKSIVKSILSGPAYFHIWFLYVLIALYLITPILRRLVKHAGEKAIWIATLLCFLFIFLAKPVENYFGMNFDITIDSFPAYIGFFLAGYLVRKAGDIKKWIVISAVGLIASTSYTIYLTYVATRSADKLIGKYYGYAAINIIMASLCAFILLKFAGEFLETKSKPWYPKLVTTLSEASFGIYLVHVIVIYWLKDGTLDFKLQAFTFSPILAIPLTTFVVFLISFAIIYLIQKIPILEKIV